MLRGRYKPQVSSNLAAFRKTGGIFESEHERQGTQHSHTADLPQEVCLWVDLLGYAFQPAVILPDMLGQGGDGLQDRPQGWHKLLGQVLCDPVVEAFCGAFGEASPKRLDRSADVVDELGPGTHQRIARAEERKVCLGGLPTVLDRGE